MARVWTAAHVTRASLTPSASVTSVSVSPVTPSPPTTETAPYVSLLLFLQLQFKLQIHSEKYERQPDAGFVTKSTHTPNLNTMLDLYLEPELTLNGSRGDAGSSSQSLR